MEKKVAKKPFYKRRKYWVIALVLVLAFFAIKAATGQNSPVREKATLTRGEVREELVLSGEIRAVQEARLQFNSSGTLSYLGVKVGDRVTKGQALAKLDTVLLNASYGQALATLRAAEATVDRVHDDLKGKDKSETFLERETRVTAEAAKDRAYEGFVAAQKALRDSTIVAPFSGLISSITNESTGVNVTAGTPQLVIVNPATLYFSVDADQTEISQIHIGDNAEIVLDPFTDVKLPAKVSQISFTPNPQESGTVYPVRLTLSVDNSSYQYRLGMSGDARFILSKKDNVLFVPNKFIKTDREGKYILVNNGADKVYVTAGIEGDDRTEVIVELPEGTEIFN